ncbi:hypothetical protein GCM10023188_27460 [Pontibacter saemangeumensis]|uniref:PH domain-containing protein n=1 Tax=Pontibacter saemangeumensis TaxID=1084525 RepID=A0ABP8LS77_9BACT
MKVYRNREGGFREIQKKALWTTVPLVALALTFGFGISYYNSGSSDFSALPFVVLIGLGAGGIGIFKGLNRQQELFRSYSLTIDEDAVQREQSNTTTLRIRKADIQEIVRCPNGSFLIKGKGQADIIVVSAQIGDYEDLEASLREIGEINSPVAKSLTERLILPFILGGLGLMAIVYLSTNRYLVLVSGTMLVSGLVWAVCQVQTSRNVDRKTKRSNWWTVVVILAVLGILYSKLVG